MSAAHNWCVRSGIAVGAPEDLRRAWLHAHNVASTGIAPHISVVKPASRATASAYELLRGAQPRVVRRAHSAAACLSVPLSMGHSAAAAGLAGSNPLSAMPQLRTGMPSLQTERHCRASLRAAWAPAEQQWKHGSSRSRQQRTAARAVAAWQRIKPFRALTTSAEEAVEALPPAEHRRTTRGGLRTPPSLLLAVLWLRSGAWKGAPLRRTRGKEALRHPRGALAQ